VARQHTLEIVIAKAEDADVRNGQENCDSAYPVDESAYGRSECQGDTPVMLDVVSPD
jgi:hypothetical protein